MKELTYRSPWAACRPARGQAARRSCDRRPPGSSRCSRGPSPRGWRSASGSRSSRPPAPPPASGSPARPSGATRGSTTSSGPASVRRPAWAAPAPPVARTAPARPDSSRSPCLLRTVRNSQFSGSPVSHHRLLLFQLTCRSSTGHSYRKN